MQTESAALQRVLKWPLWPVVGIVLGIKALLYLFSVVSCQVINNIPVNSVDDFLKIWNRWDAIHYVSIATHGYASAGERLRELIYFPLFPWLVRLAALALHDVVFSSLFVSGVASVAAGILFYHLVRLDDSEERAWQSVLFFLIFPTSYFLHAGYPESLFISWVLGSFLAARHKQWLLAGLLGALASMTRINGILIVPALLFEAHSQYKVERRWRWEWLFIGAAGLGFVVHVLLNNHFAKDPFAFLSFFNQYHGKKLAWPWIGIYQLTESEILRETWEGQMVIWQEIFFIVFCLVCLVICYVKKIRPSYLAWMTLNWLLFISTAFIQSTPRYTLALFPIFILFGRMAFNRLLYFVVVAWSLIFLSFFTALFVSGRWAF